MAITRTPIIDDDGSGTKGTIIDNAWKQELYGQIDAADAANAATILIANTNGINTVTGVGAITSVTMPALAPNDLVTVTVSLYQSGAGMTGGLYLVLANQAFRIDDVGGAGNPAAGATGLWTGTFRSNQFSNTAVAGVVTGGSGTGLANVGASRMGALTMAFGGWSTGGWTIILQCNGQAAGGSQYWNLKIVRG